MVRGKRGPVKQFNPYQFYNWGACCAPLNFIKSQHGATPKGYRLGTLRSNNSRGRSHVRRSFCADTLVVIPTCRQD